MSCTHDEIVSQPDLWRRVAELSTDPLPADGEHIAVVGCGTSWFIAQAYTVYRERLGKGAGDAYTATEFPWGRTFDRVICLSRSGTTTEIIQVMKRLHEEGRPALLITAVAGGPAAEYASEEVVLDFADETSVVQTRFATSALQYFLGSLGHDVEASAADAERALTMEIPSRWVDADQISFLGTGWTIGLAAEAGLKLREASQSWTEVYPAMEYRHGPI
ncbi:MAG: SIS domain-containing protein, partial [Schaalia sp.]|nr:SIS domain-containing protein [Schaalia sp.]